MTQAVSNYQPFDHSLALRNSLNARWNDSSEGFVQTMQKVILVVGLALLTFLTALFEGIITLPLIAARRCCYSQQRQAPIPQLPAPPPVRQPEHFPPPHQEPQEVAIPEIPQQAQEVEEQFPFPDFNHLIQDIDGQELAPIHNVAEILGNPHFLRFPEDPNFVARAIRRAIETISPEKAQLYAQLLADPEQEGEINPYLWTTACAIVHCLCCWHFAHDHRANFECPNFLAPYLAERVNGAESLRNLEATFNGFVNNNQQRRYDLQAAVMMKIREPYKNWRLDPVSRLLVQNILKLAHVVSQTPRFRDLYPEAIALYPNQQR